MTLIKPSLLFVLVPAGLLLAGCGPDEQTENEANGPANEDRALDDDVPSVKLTSPTIKPGEEIPKQHTADGTVVKDLSPELAWDDVPEQAETLALICDDPDAPRDEPWVHWVIYNIPVDAGGLPSGLPGQHEVPESFNLSGAKQGLNSWSSDNVGYRGPDPPAGPVHHYHFKLYALDTTLDLPPEEATKAALVEAMEGHIVGRGELVGTYQR